MDAVDQERLSLLESRDVVKRKLQGKFHREPTDAKCRDVIAHVAQGRQFCESAANAGPLVRPLLLYYGLLAFARGVILTSEYGLRSTNLPARHGLEVVDWSDLNKDGPAGLESIVDLKVRVTEGTFPRLCRALGG